MFSSIRKQVTPSAVIATVALVFAVTGGAYAAGSSTGGGSNGGQGTASVAAKKKAAKKPATGKPGPRGPAGVAGVAGAAGPAGPQGPVGAAGAKGENGAAGAAGADGKDGTNGTDGTNGKDGKSVEVIPVPAGQTECAGNGGAIVGPEGSPETEVCNGSPWGVGSLPPGKTEMGAWAVGNAPAVGEFFEGAPISFAVPLSEGSTVASVHFVNSLGEEEQEGEVVAAPAENCHGTRANPSAPPGMLCVYQGGASGAILSEAIRLGRAGVVLEFKLNESSAEEPASARGTWAVTAPTS
jgi:hypothetical protein